MCTCPKRWALFPPWTYHTHRWVACGVRELVLGGRTVAYGWFGRAACKKKKRNLALYLSVVYKVQTCAAHHTFYKAQHHQHQQHRLLWKPVHTCGGVSFGAEEKHLRTVTVLTPAGSPC